ncbi:MAG: TetR/AcrR family transcriptional regulator [Herpetosiphon sp.]
MLNDVLSTKNQSPPRPLKERQREERKELILQTAEAVLTEKGYYDTSIDEIATRVGIAKGTVYLHFPSKEDLVVALVERGLLTFLSAVEQAVSQPATARERLERIINATYNDNHGTRTHFFLSLANSPDVRVRLFEKQEALREHLDRFTATISAVIEQGKMAGEFKEDVPTAVMVATCIGLLSPRVYEHLLRDQQLSREELVSAVGRIFFHGIASHSTR